MTLLLRTDAVAAAERFDFWQQASASTFGALDVGPLHDRRDEQFDGVLRAEFLGALHVCDIRASPHQVRRTARLIAKTGHDCYKVALQLGGSSAVEQDGRRSVIQPGDAVLYDCTRPYQVRFESGFHLLVLVIPRELLRLPAAGADLTATALPARTGAGRLFADFTRCLMREASGLRPASATRMSDSVVDLLWTLLSERSELEPAPDSAQRTLLLRVNSFIEQRLSEPSLCPETVARAHHISTRYLHKLFEHQEHSVAGYIRSRRLEQCRRDLRDPTQRQRPVSTVAAGWGFLDAAHFSKLFKATYGCSPSTYRAAS